GRLQHVLLTRHRPRLPDPPPGSPGRSSSRPPGPRRDQHRRRGRHGPAIVELQVPTTLLAALDPAAHPHWARLLTDLQTRLAQLYAPGGPPPGAPDQHLAPEQARHRRPSTEVQRWLQVRDRCCVAPACRRTAHATDIDHTLDHALGGPTLSRALGCWCRHHHRAKHHGGWQVTQPEPGRFLITTRAG
ncbi:HNH endonuclease signature motif containing protein, partial [Actinomycetospora sp. NBRC 106375]|uniref:HNH endonuclease signature motif containing protein n=1 Tax=Actinomycetospora sp. NBRC 106375 TaxID=3032207 RepID=UPI00255453CD